LGAGIEGNSEIIKDEQLYQAQMTQTIAKLLGLHFKAQQPIEKAMAISVK